MRRARKGFGAIRCDGSLAEVRRAGFVTGECDHSHPVQEPVEEQEQDDDGRGEDDEDRRGQSEQEDPVAPGVAMRLAQVAHDEAVVAAVGFPGDVEEVAEERDGADEDADAEVDCHAQQGDVRDAANPRSEDEDGGSDAGDDIPEAGNEADEAIEPEADAGAGDAEPVVEKVRVEVEILVGEEAFEAAAKRGRRAVRGQNLRVGLGGHNGGMQARRGCGIAWARFAAMLQSRLEWRL
jgi:hypothetical protein